MKIEDAVNLIVSGPTTERDKETFEKAMDQARAIVSNPWVARLVDAALDLHARQGIPLVHALMVSVQFGYQLRSLTETNDEPPVNAAEIVEKTLASLGLSGNSTH